GCVAVVGGGGVYKTPLRRALGPGAPGGGPPPLLPPAQPKRTPPPRPPPPAPPQRPQPPQPDVYVCLTTVPRVTVGGGVNVVATGSGREGGHFSQKWPAGQPGAWIYGLE